MFAPMRAPAAQIASSAPTLAARLAQRWTSLALAASILVPSALAQTKPDQVHVWNARRGEIQVFSGVVTEDGLEKVKLTDKGGKEVSKKSLDVRRIVWGEVPASFSDGMLYFDRGDFENAVAKFRTAATDSEARDVAQAAARYYAVQSLVGWGATDASRFTEAVQEADRFLSAYTDNRHLPLVREAKARATLLTGDLAGAGALYRSLFDECKEESDTYDFTLCMRAGKEAAHALLQTGTPDTVAAREVFGDLDSRISAKLAELDEDDIARPELEGLQQAAQLGEGYVLLAQSGQANQAKLFFSSRANSLSDATPEVRFGTLFGLAKSLQAAGELSNARIEYARVAALDFTNRDRTASALLGFAECTIELQDSTNWSTEARTRLDRIVEKFGDTPAAKKAREHLDKL